MSAPLSDRLDLLFAYTEKQHPFTPAEVATLITAIDAVKILDPACGSGAFPMGVLHKLVYILGKLDPDNERWKQTQLAKLDSAPMREELERAFADNNDDYGRKLYLIENCLYGVDIQPIAIQITKLRFFISLVCDQKTNRNKKDNLGIRPLPNLETKFVAANSLIGLPIPEPDLFIKSLIEPVEKEIEAAYHGHFTIQRRDQKLALQKKIKTLRQKLTDTLLDGLGANKGSEVAKKAQHLADWDPFDPQSSADFFDPHWMFGRSLKHGFDVVIGNPPYVRIQMLAQADPKQPARLKERYASASKGNYDLYVVFVERGLQLLQPHGQLSYILPHKFFNAQYGEPLRKLLADAKNLRQVVHFGDEQIFPGATNYVCLLFLDKGGAEQCRWIPVDDLPAWLSDGAANETAIASNRFTTAEWNFTAGKGASLFERLQRMPVKLGEIAEMFVGLQTSADTVFLFKAGIRIQGALAQVWSKELNREVEVERALLKPVIRSGRIGRYWATQTAWVLFPYKRDERKLRLLSDAEMQNQFPCAWKYLSSNKRLLEEREHGKFSKEWWQLYPKNLDLWEEPKIMLPYMISELAAFYDEGANYFVNVTTGGFGLRLCNSELDVKYVTGLLNSHLLDWFLKKVSTTFHGGYFAANKQFLVQLPIRRITFSSKSERAQHDAIVSLVEGILAAKQANPAADTSALEREIDQQVYALYGLTPEEIAIVEGTAP